MTCIILVHDGLPSTNRERKIEKRGGCNGQDRDRAWEAKANPSGLHCGGGEDPFMQGKMRPSG